MQIGGVDEGEVAHVPGFGTAMGRSSPVLPVTTAGVP
jgi:hypothetical protein